MKTVTLRSTLLVGVGLASWPLYALSVLILVNQLVDPVAKAKPKSLALLNILRSSNPTSFISTDIGDVLQAALPLPEKIQFNESYESNNECIKENVYYNKPSSESIWYVSKILPVGTDIYAVGELSQNSYVIKWNGANWTVIGSASRGSISSIGVYGSELYASGTFTEISGFPAKWIAKWNGTKWSGVGTGVNGPVTALAVSGNDVYVSVEFSKNKPLSASSADKRVGELRSIQLSEFSDYSIIAKWNGKSWKILGTGPIKGYISGIAVGKSSIYASGSFGSANTCLTKWDGTKWTAMSGIASSREIRALLVHGNNLYLGGNLVLEESKQNGFIACWDGTRWSILGSRFNPEIDHVNSLAANGNALYVGGSFQNIGKRRFNYVAKWDGKTWSTLETGLNSVVSCMAMNGGDLYVGGSFTSAGSIPVQAIARWDGTRWFSVGPGLPKP